MNSLYPRLPGFTPLFESPADTGVTPQARTDADPGWLYVMGQGFIADTVNDRPVSEEQS